VFASKRRANGVQPLYLKDLKLFAAHKDQPNSRAKKTRTLALPMYKNASQLRAACQRWSTAYARGSPMKGWKVLRDSAMMRPGELMPGFMKRIRRAEHVIDPLPRPHPANSTATNRFPVLCRASHESCLFRYPPQLLEVLKKETSPKTHAPTTSHIGVEINKVQIPCAMQNPDDFNALADFTIKNQVVSDRKGAHARHDIGTVPPYLWILPEYVTLGVNFPQRFVCRRFAVLRDVLPYFEQVAFCGGCAGKLRHNLD
jgi:hypothetical protein